MWFRAVNRAKLLLFGALAGCSSDLLGPLPALIDGYQLLLGGDSTGTDGLVSVHGLTDSISKRAIPPLGIILVPGSVSLQLKTPPPGAAYRLSGEVSKASSG